VQEIPVARFTEADVLAGGAIRSVGNAGATVPPVRCRADLLQRRIDAAPGDVVELGAGVYRLSRPLVITNGCSLRLHKNATLKAIAPMDALLKVDLSGGRGRDLGVFFTGGVIDGNGLASCMTIDGFHHPTMRDMVFCNGKVFGLHVGGAKKGGCELIADNLYFRCNLRGLAGNTALKLDISDCHFTDIVIVDWTVGIDVVSGGANRFTRCHVWGGAIRPKKKGDPCEMLVGSVCFRVREGACNNTFRDCYADTGKTGFECAGWETAFFGCSYYDNYSWTKLDDVTVIRQTGGTMSFESGFIHKGCPTFRLYEGTGRIHWSNMRYSRFGKNDPRPGAVTYGGTATESSDAGLDGKPVKAK